MWSHSQHSHSALPTQLQHLYPRSPFIPSSPTAVLVSSPCPLLFLPSYHLMPLPSLLRRVRVSSYTPSILGHTLRIATMSSSAASPAASLPRLPIFDAISRHDPTSTAVIHSLSGRSFQYGELLGDVRRARDSFLGATGQKDLNGQRIAFLVENSYDYVGECGDFRGLTELTC